MGRTAGSTAEGTRQRILDAATELFEERGFAGTSIRDLAVRVGMTKAALYYHFQSKEDVLQALLSPFLDEVDRLIAGTAAGEWTRADLVERLVAQVNDRGDFLYAVLGDPSVKHAVFSSLDLPTRMGRLLRVLAGSDDPASMLRGRCAMGALMSGLLGGHDHPKSGLARPPRPVVSDADRRTITSCVLAVLGLSPASPTPAGSPAGAPAVTPALKGGPADPDPEPGLLRSRLSRAARCRVLP